MEHYLLIIIVLFVLLLGALIEVFLLQKEVIRMRRIRANDENYISSLQDMHDGLLKAYKELSKQIGKGVQNV